MNIKQRQAEGIAAAKAREIKFGRPSLPLLDNFYQVHREWRAGKMSVTQADLEKQYLLEKLEKLRAEAENCLKSTSPNKQYFWWKIPWEQLERYLLINLSEPTGNGAWRFETRWECVKIGDVQDLLFWEERHFSDFSDNSTMEFFETSKYSAEERSELMKRYADSQKRSDRDAWYWYHGKSIYSMDTGKLYDSIDSYLLSADESGGETWERIELPQGGKIEVPEEESAEKRFDEIIEEINNATGTTFKNANVTEENEKFVCTYVSEQGNKIFLTWDKSNACLSGVEVSGSRGEEWVAAKDVLVGLPELGLELENAAIFTGEVKRREDWLTYTNGIEIGEWKVSLFSVMEDTFRACKLTSG